MSQTFVVGFLVVWAIGVLVVWPLHIRAAIRSRRELGEPLRPEIPAGALYGERSASGRCDGHFAGASRCLVVVVADGELWITSIFPFTVWFAYGRLGLDYRLPKSKVTSAQARKGWSGYNIVIQLPDQLGVSKTVRLRLRDPDAFLAALAT